MMPWRLGDNLGSMTPSERIPIAGPWITELEVAYAAEAAATNWYDRANDFVGRFEGAFAEQTNRRFSVSLPSCTSAIHLSLLALGVGPGDEVLVPDVTWIASAAPLAYVGADPGFVDVDQDTWCMRPDALEKRLTPRTKAVIAVDLYGSMPDFDALSEVAAAHGVPIIEDAAEAAGSRYRGRPAGAFGIASTFSFHGSKTLTTGEGGMLLTDEERIYHRVLILRDHGRHPGDSLFFNQEVAYKYKMSSLQAAIGLAQLERLDELVERKRQIFGWYRDGLADLPLTLNAEPQDVRNSYWMTTVVVDPAAGVQKEALQRDLAAAGIDSRPFFYPLSSLPAYASAVDSTRARRDNEVAYRISPWGLNLPSALNLTEAQVSRVSRRASCHSRPGRGGAPYVIVMNTSSGSPASVASSSTRSPPFVTQRSGVEAVATNPRWS